MDLLTRDELDWLPGISLAAERGVAATPRHLLDIISRLDKAIRANPEAGAASSNPDREGWVRESEVRPLIEHRIGLYVLAAEKAGQDPETAMRVIADRDPLLARAADALRARLTGIPVSDTEPPIEVQPYGVPVMARPVEITVPCANCGSRRTFRYSPPGGTV